MVPRYAIVAAASLLLAASPAFAAGKPGNQSWGKAGVSFEQYRADALDCANQAYGVEVQMRPLGPGAASGYAAAFLPGPVWTMLGGSTIHVTNMHDLYVHAAWVDTVEQLQAVVDSCLADRGYQRFRLTSAQMRALRRLPQSSPERQHYLHSLGSNAQVLSEQRL